MTWAHLRKSPSIGASAALDRSPALGKTHFEEAHSATATKLLPEIRWATEGTHPM